MQGIAFDEGKLNSLDDPIRKYLPELTSRLWQPLGMELPGQWVLDEEGYELAMGGLSASARDYAKLGLRNAVPQAPGLLTRQ